MNLFERKQIDSLFWSYYPSKYKNILYETIYNEVKILLKKNSSRYSCVLSDRLNNEYSNIDTHFWTTNIENIKDEIEKTFNIHVDYGLVHLYEDGESSINWHNDKEAIDSFIVSVSFGSPRRFQLREFYNNENKFTYELFHGDMFIMKRGCQELYEHCIIKDKKITKPRISITFRERTK